MKADRRAGRWNADGIPEKTLAKQFLNVYTKANLIYTYLEEKHDS